MFNPKGAKLLAELIFERLENEKVDFIGGLEMGAVPLISPFNMLSFEKGRPIPGFFVRKNVKEHGTKKLIEGVYGGLKDKNVVILDDVTTTGGSAMQAVKAVQEVGANVTLVLTIVDREEGAADFYKSSEFLSGGYSLRMNS